MSHLLVVRDIFQYFFDLQFSSNIKNGLNHIISPIFDLLLNTVHEKILAFHLKNLKLEILTVKPCVIQHIYFHF